MLLLIIDGLGDVAVDALCCDAAMGQAGPEASAAAGLLEPGLSCDTALLCSASECASGDCSCEGAGSGGSSSRGGLLGSSYETGRSE